MASYEFELGSLPDKPRRQELWIQHAAGFIMFQDARNYAIDRIAADVDENARREAIAAVDNALYGMMMIADNVSGHLDNEDHTVELQLRVRLTKKNQDDETPVFDFDLCEGDGMCMGFSGWVNGDFGDDPVAVRKSAE